MKSENSQRFYFAIAKLPLIILCDPPLSKLIRNSPVFHGVFLPFELSVEEAI